MSQRDFSRNQSNKTVFRTYFETQPSTQKSIKKIPLFIKKSLKELLLTNRRLSTQDPNKIKEDLLEYKDSERPHDPMLSFT